MKNLFSIGEISKQQNISRQTLIFYDKIGLFCPAYVDPQNGYRYYSSSQLDYLDTICIMKKIGFSLEEIKEHMKNYTIEHSITALRKQLSAINRQISELQMIKSRVEHRCQQLECVLPILENSETVTLEMTGRQYLLLQEVEPPYSLDEISMATKHCFVRSFQQHLPVYFQCGVIVPFSRIKQKKYVEASHAFLPIEKVNYVEGVIELPAGKCVCSYHVGDYLTIGATYERILRYCDENGLRITSDSYEFAINDYLSTGDENEYVTKIMFYVKQQPHSG